MFIFTSIPAKKKVRLIHYDEIRYDDATVVATAVLFVVFLANVFECDPDDAFIAQ